jgi:phage shock protein PspC (stress-responsive transcriptional regulator)
VIASIVETAVTNVTEARLVYNWKAILLKAWSVRWAVISGLLSGVAAVLPYFDNSMSRLSFVVLTIVVSVGASVSALLVVWARVTYQANMHNDA